MVWPRKWGPSSDQLRRRRSLRKMNAPFFVPTRTSTEPFDGLPMVAPPVLREQRLPELDVRTRNSISRPAARKPLDRQIVPENPLPAALRLENGLRCQVAAAHRALHRGGPAGPRPVARQEQIAQ